MSVVYPATNPVNYGNLTIGGGGGGAGSGQVITVANGTGASWATSNTAKMTAHGELNIEGENADIIVNDNLRQAYEHYKTLEALLYEQEKAEK